MNPQRQRQIAKYRGLKCLVCGKWGATAAADAGQLAMRDEAKSRGLTLRDSQAPGIHDKCARRLRDMLANLDRGARKLADLIRFPFL